MDPWPWNCPFSLSFLTSQRPVGHRARPPTSRRRSEGRWGGSDCLLSLFSNSDEAVLARTPSPRGPWPSLLVGEEPQAGPDTARAAWAHSTFKAVANSLSFLSCPKTTLSPCCRDRPECFEDSTMLATGWGWPPASL